LEKLEMLRMGRNPKTDSNENEKQAQPQPQQHAPYGTPATYNTPAPYNAPPAPPAPPAASPAFANTEPPAQPESERPQSGRAMTETETLAREIKDGTMSGFVGGGTVLSGEAAFKGMLRIDGHLTGRISSEKGTLIVSSGGRVDASIEVATAKINGVVNGDVIASERLELGRSAQVYGNVQTPVLVIEQGAIFEGGCRMKQAEAAPQKTERADKTQRNDSTARSSSSSLPPPVAAAARSAAPEAVKASNPV
jgi:cytoskeletal protein CcmA (bactofilin family)